MSIKLHKLVRTAFTFFCRGNTTIGYNVFDISTEYNQDFIGLMNKLKDFENATSEVAVLDAVDDLYNTSMEHMRLFMVLVESLIGMIQIKNDIDLMKRIILQEETAVNISSKPSELETILKKQEMLVCALKDILEYNRKSLETEDGNPFINITQSSNISRLLDSQYWAQQIEEQARVFSTYQTVLGDWQHIESVMDKVQPVTITIVLVVGMMGNGLLLTIFVRHKKMRTLPYCMLINLTVVDLVSLVVNVLLDHIRVTTHWQMNWISCQIYFFFSYLMFAVSTYSVAMISVQRFVAVKLLHSLAWCHQSKKIKYFLIATVWYNGIILSVPHAGAAYIENENCKEISLEHFVPTYTADLITFCVVPLLITAVFSVLTTYRMRRSFREIPGKTTGQEQLKHSRMVTSKVLVGLTVLFVVSYAPFFSFKLQIFGVGISTSFWKFILVNKIVYYLRFANCCLKPIVLFVVSKRFRGYIMRYCVERKVHPACNSGTA
jgi:hypothetical protein